MMKKLFALLLAGVMMLSLVACGGTDGGTKKDDNASETVVEEEAAITATTTTATTTTTAAKKEDWVLKYYVDEFDQPTSDWYISNRLLITGKFSNSATTNSKLSVQLLLDSEDICFMLYEYGNNKVKNSYSRNKYYDIKMKDANGTEYTLRGGIVSGGDRIALLSQYRKTVLKALKQEGTVSFYIQDSERTVVSYLFSVQTSNLGDLLTLLT